MVKVAVLGAGGGVGQALSLQLRLSPLVDELALYDRSQAVGVAVDLSHLPARQVIKGYKAIDNGLTSTLKGADIVILSVGSSVLPAGVVLVSRNDLLKFSASVVGSMIESCAKVCPKSIIIVVSNPINPLVPFAAEILKKHNAFDARRLFGVTTLDVVRAETFLAEMLGTMSEHGPGVEVDVIGGHSTETIVPLFSHVDAAKRLSSVQVDELVHHTCMGGMDVFRAKERKGAATLSTAHATIRMVERVCRALKGEKGMRECSFVYLPGIEGGTEIAKAVGVDFFSVPFKFTVNGAGRIDNPLNNLSELEARMVLTGVKQLKEDVKLGSEMGKAFGSESLKTRDE